MTIEPEFGLQPNGGRASIPPPGGEPAQAGRGDSAGAELPLTEEANPRSRGIDGLGALEIVSIIHDEDLRAWEAAGTALAAMAEVVEEVVRAFRAGGRLVYIGAGTSGRLGVLDASECHPTFGVSPDRIHGIIAGGEAALRTPVEGAEDSPTAGAAAMRQAGVRAQDVVCGIAASGTTPYVWGALEEASYRNATTVLVTCNPEWRHGGRADMVDFIILTPVGPEVIAGSTRMKAGTATKLVLNTISTAAMIRWGKVYDNLMIDVAPVSRKLRRRAEGLVSHVAGVDASRASELLAAAGGSVKAAVLISRMGLDPAQARDILDRHGGLLREALESQERPGDKN